MQNPNAYGLLLGALLLSGCGILKKKAPEGATSATAAATSAAPAYTAPAADTAPVATAQAAIDDAAVPAPQDFEDEAFEKVTSANFKAQLADLNKAITAPAK